MPSGIESTRLDLRKGPLWNRGLAKNGLPSTNSSYNRFTVLNPFRGTHTLLVNL